MSRFLDIPAPFLAKVLQLLTRAGLLEAQRGPTGGVRLARPAESIHLADVVEAIDGADPFLACLYGWPECNQDEPCPLHEAWGQPVSSLATLMRSVSLQEAAAAVDRRPSARPESRSAAHDPFVAQP